ncbi:uncharacterized protein [Gossypium hirsutum]|uniref:Reverse transcriptase RNase H-like domain-containing protein n=1 Tax=Gossypium hirsutum TaxID=3635 RepID=A0ABM3A355_GOSHI|nr:uncharacterized protein LOC107941579 [Gossypium hirsutum]
MTPQRARELISIMAANSQQYRPNSEPTRRVNGVNDSSLEDKLDKLTNIVQSMLTEKKNLTQLCGICTTSEHPTDLCPILNENLTAHVDAVGGFPGPLQRRYDPFSNTYNPGWKDHLNLNYEVNPRYNPSYQPKPPQPPPKPSTSLEAIMERLAVDAAKYQQRTDASIQELTNQVSKLSMAVNHLESQGKLPSQTEPNPRQNASAITLRSGKILETVPDKSHRQDKEWEKQIFNPKAGLESEIQKPVMMPTVTMPPSFLGRLAKDKKDNEEKEILETFRKVEVKIPLLDAIKQTPHYAKFLKELCTSKRRLIGNERVNVGENVSAILQKKVPPKYKDQCMFAISCEIGNVGIKKAMCDLGASINVMPYPIYKSINMGHLKETGVIIQLADRSVVYPEGLLEDVLAKVNELVFLVDFYIINIEDDNSTNSSDILLGKPFLSTASAKIDVRSGTLTMEFNDEIVKFNVYEAMGHPNSLSNISNIDIIDCLTQSYSEYHDFDELETILYRSIDMDVLSHLEELSIIEDPLREIVKHLETQPSLTNRGNQFELLPSQTKMLPSILQPPTFELKALPDHLKILFSHQFKDEEESLVRVLRDYKEAIGWTIADIKGLSPSTCMHRISIEDNTKPKRDAERRLNPPMMEVVKKEIQKLLDVGMIYPISDSDWRCMVSIFSDYVEKIIEVFMDDFTVYEIGLCSHNATPNWNFPFEIICDVSDRSVGAVLGQRIGKEPHVLYYASKTLDAAQSNYTTTEKELLAVVFALDKFRSYLLGTKVIIFSDHTALKYLIGKKEAKPRLIRWILLLQEFDFEIRDKKGCENLVPDHLSRLSIPVDDTPLKDNFLDENLFSAKVIHPLYADIVNYLDTGTVLSELPRSRKDKIKKYARYYIWYDPYLWKHYSDQYDTPRALISDRGTRFCNKIVSALMEKY